MIIQSIKAMGISFEIASLWIPRWMIRKLEIKKYIIYALIESVSHDVSAVICCSYPELYDFENYLLEHFIQIPTLKMWKVLCLLYSRGFICIFDGNWTAFLVQIFVCGFKWQKQSLSAPKIFEKFNHIWLCT